VRQCLKEKSEREGLTYSFVVGTLEITSAGEVERIVVASESPPGTSAECLDSAYSWRFSPDPEGKERVVRYRWEAFYEDPIEQLGR